MTIGIFTAMEKEAASFLQNGEYAKSSVSNCDIYELTLGCHRAVLCCPPSVGEIAAASACQMLISNFNVDVILNFGVVGALTDKTSLCSFLYVGSVVHYDMDVSQADEHIAVGRYGCFDDVAVHCDKSLIDRALQVCDLPVVRCASADKFVSAPEQKTALNVNFGAEICDMESAGILFTCKFNNVPCLLVKCVSDSLVGGADEYSQNAVRAASGFFEFAERLVQQLD